MTPINAENVIIKLKEWQIANGDMRCSYDVGMYRGVQMVLDTINAEKPISTSSHVYATARHCRDCKYFYDHKERNKRSGRVGYWNTCRNPVNLRYGYHLNSVPSKIACKEFERKEEEQDEVRD